LEVDPQYLQFLSLSDVLAFNGYTVFASRIVPLAAHPDRLLGGFVDTNVQLHEAEPNRRFIAFGETGNERYVLTSRGRPSRKWIIRRSMCFGISRRSTRCWRTCWSGHWSDSLEGVIGIQSAADHMDAVRGQVDDEYRVVRHQCAPRPPS
jgi:hypothetical protein